MSTSRRPLRPAVFAVATFYLLAGCPIVSTGPAFGPELAAVLNLAAQNNEPPQTACDVDGELYLLGQLVPSPLPCQTCECGPLGVVCVQARCELRTGCRAVQRQDQCCPDYICECLVGDHIYDNGARIPEAGSPCQVCYCRGGSVECAVLECYWRDDCEPKYEPGRCCPKFDHCPPPDTQYSSRPMNSSNTPMMMEATTTTTTTPGLPVVKFQPVYPTSTLKPVVNPDSTPEELTPEPEKSTSTRAPTESGSGVTESAVEAPVEPSLSPRDSVPNGESIAESLETTSEGLETSTDKVTETTYDNNMLDVESTTNLDIGTTGVNEKLEKSANDVTESSASELSTDHIAQLSEEITTTDASILTTTESSTDETTHQVESKEASEENSTPEVESTTLVEQTTTQEINSEDETVESRSPDNGAVFTAEFNPDLSGLQMIDLLASDKHSENLETTTVINDMTNTDITTENEGTTETSTIYNSEIESRTSNDDSTTEDNISDVTTDTASENTEKNTEETTDESTNETDNSATENMETIVSTSTSGPLESRSENLELSPEDYTTNEAVTESKTNEVETMTEVTTEKSGNMEIESLNSGTEMTPEEINTEVDLLETTSKPSEDSTEISTSTNFDVESRTEDSPDGTEVPETTSNNSDDVTTTEETSTESITSRTPAVEELSMEMERAELVPDLHKIKQNMIVDNSTDLTTQKSVLTSTTSPVKEEERAGIVLPDSAYGESEEHLSKELFPARPLAAPALGGFNEWGVSQDTRELPSVHPWREDEDLAAASGVDDILPWSQQHLRRRRTSDRVAQYVHQRRQQAQ